MIILAPQPKEFTDDFWKVKNFKLSIGEIVEKRVDTSTYVSRSNSQTNMRTIISKKPETLGDLRETMDYVEKQSLHLLSAAHRTGRELQRFRVKGASPGLMDHVAMEVGDIAQIVATDMPKGSEDAPLVELGFRTIDAEKPVILCIGHNVAPGAGIMNYLEDEGLEEDVEVCGICCAARYNPVQQERQGCGPLLKTA